MRWGLAGACVVLFPGLARAEEAPPPAEPAPLEVRVIGDRADALHKIPGSGTVITAKDIERAHPQDTAEMLRRVPGLLVRQDETGGTRLDIGVRGLDPTRGRRVLLLEDGMPIEINPYAEPDLYFSPPIERYRAIEVVKGSGSILFGPQTIGGVINFITLAPPSDRRISAEVDGGSYGYVKALAAYGDAYKGVRFLVQAFHKQADGVRDEPWQADDVLAKVAFETSERGELTLKIGFHDERAVSTAAGMTQAMFLANPRRPTFAPDDYLHARKVDVSMVHEHQFTPETKLRTLAYAYTTTRIWRRQDYDRGPVPGTIYDRIVGDTATSNGALYFKHTNSIPDRVYDVAGLEPKLEQKFITAGVKHVLDAGARVLIESGHRAERAGDDPKSDAGELVLDETHRTYAFAGYVQDRIAFRDYLVVSPGLRIEHAQFERTIHRQILAIEPEDVNVEGSSFDTAFIPGIGLVLGRPDMHLFAGFHLGYAPPRVVTAIAATGVDEQLEPERSKAYELGARLRRGKVVRAEATGFLTNFENQIISGNVLTGARSTLINGGATRHLGFEAGVVVGLGAAFRLPLVVDVGGNYTLSRATFEGGDNAGKVLPYAPEHMANGTLDVEHESGVGAQLAWVFTSRQFTDEQDTVAVDPTGRIGAIDPHGVVDVALRYKNRRTGLTVNAAVKNVADAVYVLSRRPDGIFPGSPRTFIGGLRWDHGR